MNVRVIVLFIALVICSPLPTRRAYAQAAAPDTTAKATAITFAERAAVRALGFTEGDARSLSKSKPDFTDSAWTFFMKQLGGFVDAKGAPQFSSLFTAAGPAAVAGEKDGVLRLRIPGELVQGTRASRTTYRVAVEVDVGGTPRKIQRFAWSTCVGEAARRYCM